MTAVGARRLKGADVPSRPANAGHRAIVIPPRTVQARCMAVGPLAGSGAEAIPALQIPASTSSSLADGLSWASPAAVTIYKPQVRYSAPVMIHG